MALCLTERALACLWLLLWRLGPLTFAMVCEQASAWAGAWVEWEAMLEHRFGN